MAVAGQRARVVQTAVGGVKSKNRLFRETPIDPTVIRFIDDNGLGRRKLRSGNKRWRNSVEVAPHQTLTGRAREIWAGGRGWMTGSWDAENGDRLHSIGQRHDVPEVALIGRSNVGKSSLMNAILGSGLRISKVEDRPGTTLEIKRYLLPSNKLALLDLPGYGFAYSGKESWDQAFQFLHRRLSESLLKRVLILLDARHGLKMADFEMLKSLEVIPNVKYQFVLTKSDLVQPNDLARRVQQTVDLVNQRKLRADVSWINLVSSPNYRGVAALQARLATLAH